MARIEFEDIQGFAIRGYGKLTHALYVSMGIESHAMFREWLGAHLPPKIAAPQTESADPPPVIPGAIRTEKVPSISMAIGLTASGLKKLTPGGSILKESIPLEFKEGMYGTHRSRLLGDVGENAPENWRWGGPKNQNIDLILIVFAGTPDEAETFVKEKILGKSGLYQVDAILGHRPAEDKEPFGFVDGITQPIIEGTDLEEDEKRDNPKNAKMNVIKPGEIVLGYEDGSGRLPRTMAMDAAADPQNLLARHPEWPKMKDLGRNGSFLVIRQLEQNVDAFDDFMRTNCAKDQTPDELAAKVVGREKDGTPLIKSDSHFENRGFDYINDPLGYECPIGAHIRRSNPRSSVHASDHETALEVSNRHRIIRRGRVYKNEDTDEQGLMFVCLNASISRQFEFIQSTWCNNPLFQGNHEEPEFQGLQEEVDPLIGTPARAGEKAYFTIPRKPYRQKLSSMKQWVTVRGGAYLFLPGMSALRVLAGGASPVRYSANE